MSLNPLHASRIREVAVYFDSTAPDLNPDVVTQNLGVTPDRSARRGDKRQNVKGQPLQPHEEGWWQISSRGQTESKDVNKHLRYLLRQLLPHCDEIIRFAKDGEAYFGVLWKSSYLYAGTGPGLAHDCTEGVARLRAEIGFDIYHVED